MPGRIGSKHACERGRVPDDGVISSRGTVGCPEMRGLKEEKDPG